MDKKLTALAAILIFAAAVAAGAEEIAAETASVATPVPPEPTPVVPAATPSPVPEATAPLHFFINNVWVLIGGMLVFMMHLGFAGVESGLSRAKNCTNILFKNLMVPPIGFLTYAAFGFALMYPGDAWHLGHVFGFAGFGLNPPEGDPYAYNGAFTYWTDFFFQGMFAATSATIVSGAVAGRTKLNAFLLFTLVFVSLVYTLVGSWGWGGGWLADLDFHDFAGSTFVHSVGGWAALAGAIIVGPRIGKFVNGVSRPIMGHNMPLATIGVFLLWFGWFGFNGGSVLNADAESISFVLVTTMLGASAGIVGAALTSSIVLRKPDLSMTLNGCLAGLVSITAGADCVSWGSAILIGLVGGIVVVLSVLLVDKIRIDDPVGAISVHLVCGIWGTIAVGIFTTNPAYTFGVQLLGAVAAGAVAFPCAFVIFYAIKKTLGLRVAEETELRGLDVDEHGAESYAGFQIFSNQ